MLRFSVCKAPPVDIYNWSRERERSRHRTGKSTSNMPKCPTCEKEVYFAERVTSLGKDWHRACLKCKKCNKTLTPGSHSEHEGKPYCTRPCHSALFGPTGFGRGGTESHKYN
ncbi:cysteine-rich protein 1 [Heptranchias perlo]|uniref:cysteine-rich protein 1 n=1 Tax=Heptranchias perlo TaxID=212740 RepID=UPI00355A2B65